MNTIKKIAKYISLGLLLLLLGAAIYIYFSGPKLPEETNEIIEQVIANPLPELIMGRTGYANFQDIKIWYEDLMPDQAPKGVVLLVMGISNDALGWPQRFLKSFTDAGYRVIRYDHRGTGLSDWITDFDTTSPYTLSEMAFDIVSILDALQIKKANIVGISMGGMVAQELVINHPERVETLTSIMSSGNILDPSIAPISSQVAFDLIKVAIKYSVISTEKNMIKLHLASRIILMGDTSYHLNVKEQAEQVLYNLRKRRGYNPNVSKQHQTAVYNSDSRYADLKKLETKTLVIHGVSDPFIPIEHSKKYASLLPNVDSLWIDKMGHDIPDELVPTITKGIIKLLAHPHISLDSDKNSK